MKTTINHLGQSFITVHFDKDTSDEECDKIREEFFKKPSESQVINQMLKVKRKSTIHSAIHRFFFFDLLTNSKLYSQKWSVQEFMQSNDLIRFAVAKIKSAPEFFDGTKSVAENVNTVLRVAPSGTGARVSNYPIKSVREVLNNYNINNNYYDYSCGWGVRMLGSLSEGVNYFGTDPNYELTEKLNDMGTLFNKVSPAKFDVRTQGSEIFIPEWENTMGLAFSSPPYYNLEDYKIGKQSINNRDYKEWLESYWRETVKNIIKYLVNDGYMLLNIKNFKEFNLLDDMKAVCIEEGLLYIESIELKNINRQVLKNAGKDSNEEILVFSKELKTPLKTTQLDNW